MDVFSSLPPMGGHSLVGKHQLDNVDPLENQLCRVCDEPAAGFHFGAFTCEGCKSFFGRTVNNQSVIQECKNNFRCVVDKKNRTACKACRLRKCLMVGMSKSGSRYGRRSNWFKIHCLMQQNGSKSMAPKTSPVPASPISPYSRPPQATFPSLPPLTVSTPKKPAPLLSSRSPSPLNTSTDTSSVHSSPSPVPESPLPKMAEQPQIPVSPLFPSAEALSRHSALSLFHPSTLYRLSPLLALNPLLVASTAPSLHTLWRPQLDLLTDHKSHLDLLAEHRSLLDRFKEEAGVPRSCSSPKMTDTPIDLTVK